MTNIEDAIATLDSAIEEASTEAASKWDTMKRAEHEFEQQRTRWAASNRVVETLKATRAKLAPAPEPTPLKAVA